MSKQQDYGSVHLRRPLGGISIAAAHCLATLMLLTPALADAGQKPPPDGTVRIDNFAIDKAEVTIGRYSQVHKPSASHTKAQRNGGGVEYVGGWQKRPGWVWHSPHGQPGKPNEPVVHVTWSEARDFCRAVGGRLPTLKQWQRAAYTETRDDPPDGLTKGKTYPYPVGDEPSGMNTSGDDQWPRHAPAGQTRVGVNGLYDMGANVWEWLADRSDSGERALTAGGSWWYGPHMTKLDGVQFKPADFSAVYIGFRCVYDNAGQAR